MSKDQGEADVWIDFPQAHFRDQLQWVRQAAKSMEVSINDDVPAGRLHTGSPLYDIRREVGWACALATGLQSPVGDRVNSDSLLSALKRLDADSVYILLHQGWNNEARANRWHFATRWARHLPVVLVSPDTVWAGHVSRREPRIQN